VAVFPVRTLQTYNSMVQGDPISSSNPFFSIVIAVHNDWGPLERCLRSLDEQKQAPEFEVIVVDDGSTAAAPDSVRRANDSYRLILERQTHAGISVARNLGVKLSRGSVLLFTDADCKLLPDCLATLAATVSEARQDNCFQLHLIGDVSNLIGRAEQLRLLTLQSHLLQPMGRIRYLNTAGFAIRRERIDIEKDLFNPSALRAEDTFLLVSLIEENEMPLFVPTAMVQHSIPLGLVGRLLKDIQTARMERSTYQLIASKGIRIRVSQGERMAMMRSMWIASEDPSIGRMAWFVQVVRQALQRIFSFAYGWLPV
jgi:cellulose synthase/poly-beta-1,6-N-acetylglucosamine synthase-like glycosyltransferase